LEFGLQLVGASCHVKPEDQAMLLGERVSRDGWFDLIASQNVEAESEFFGHFVLPLLHEVAGRDMRQRSRSPLIISSLMSSPAMMVLPAPGSSASRKRSGWRGNISP
jgi:hypothetical protein